MALTTAAPLPRNPGPEWGYRFLSAADAWLPRPVFDFLLGAGTWAAVAVMPEPRRHSRAYLGLILGRPAGLRDVWRHFFAFAQSLLDRLRAADGRRHRCIPEAGSEPFLALMASSRPLFLGTFHVGDSDLLGFLLGDFRRRIHLVRLRMGNSSDTDRLAARFGEWISFIWSNQTGDLLFALKAAIDAGDSVAMKCDRPDYSSKLEPFRFLGARRLFPFTIYHLALIFQQPVVFCIGIPLRPGESAAVCSPVFEPNGAGREEGLLRAREHFQGVLDWLEDRLRGNPHLWFNFTPLNPRPCPRGRNMAERTAMLRPYYYCAYVLSWALFGAVGLGLNAACALLLLLPRRRERATAVRRVIRGLFTAWIKWLHASGLISVVWHGRDRLPARAVCVSNHPGLLDATFLLARLPDALCIFKPKLRGNLFLAPAAIMAGYVAGDGGVDMIRELAPQLADGNTVLIFPEGTRTDADKALNPLKSGFVLIAQRARVPIQILAIRAPRDLCPRGAGWWTAPRFPSRVDIFDGGLIPADPDRPVAEIADEVRRRLLGLLESPA